MRERERYLFIVHEMMITFIFESTQIKVKIFGIKISVVLAPSEYDNFFVSQR